MKSAGAFACHCDHQTVELLYDCCLNKAIIERGAYIVAHDATTGLVASITAPDGGTLAFSYNGGLLSNTQWSGNVTGTVSRTYDNDFRITSLSANGSGINLTYDDDGRLLQAGELTLVRSSQKNGLITASKLGNENETFNYNDFGELTSNDCTYSGMTYLAQSFDRDKLGRITQMVETIDGATTTVEYSYDLADRLIELKQNGLTKATYSYDSNSNRTSVNDNGVVTNGVYDDQDRLIQYGNTTYGYSANGELESKTTNGQTTAYAYDEFGNLLSVSKANGPLIEYVIDGWNRRIGKKVGGTLMKGFLYEDGLKPISELDGNNNVVTLFVYASHDNVPDYMVKNGVTFRIITDHLGSPRLVVDVTTGAIAQRMDYDEFGRVTKDTNPGFQPFGYAGGLYDEDTHLIRFGARDYDAETGRWTTKDPNTFKGGDTNLYEYVFGDPINLHDPTGLQPTWKQKVVTVVMAVLSRLEGQQKGPGWPVTPEPREPQGIEEPRRAAPRGGGGAGGEGGEGGEGEGGGEGAPSSSSSSFEAVVITAATAAAARAAGAAAATRVPTACSPGPILILPWCQLDPDLPDCRPGS